MRELTDEQRRRRTFNRWFSDTFACADGRYAHMPRWLKADLWLAWEAALKHQPCQHNCDEGGVCLAELSGFPQSCPATLNREVPHD